jgi:hypothetical protein
MRQLRLLKTDSASTLSFVKLTIVLHELQSRAVFGTVLTLHP